MGLWRRLFGRSAIGAEAAPIEGSSRENVVRARIRIEQQLMAAEGVVSVGVGQDAEGADAIVVGIAGTSVDPIAVPRVVDGVPVLLREIGEPAAQEPLAVGDREEAQ